MSATMIMQVQAICAAFMTVHALPIARLAEDGQALPALPTLPNTMDAVQVPSDYGFNSDLNIPYAPEDQQQQQQQPPQPEMPPYYSTDDVQPQPEIYYQPLPLTQDSNPEIASFVIDGQQQQQQPAIMSLQDGQDLQSSTIYGSIQWQNVYNSLPSQEQSTYDYYAKMGI